MPEMVGEVALLRSTRQLLSPHTNCSTKVLDFKVLKTHGGKFRKIHTPE